MQLVNTDADMHMHTLLFSDGLNTVDEMVIYAGKLGLKRIAFTDHSSRSIPKTSYATPFLYRIFYTRWKNIHNDVEVIKGVEADLLNAKGDVQMDIQGIEPDFIVLSAHTESYGDDPSTITEAYLNAIERFKGRIGCIGHLDNKYFAEHVDIVKVVEKANEHGIPLECNGTSIAKGYVDVENALLMLDHADKVMVNSDAHCLAELHNRDLAFAFLREHGYIE